MAASLEFILGLIARSDPPRAAAEDFRGPHGAALRVWQRLGFLASEPEPNRVPSCPHCREGVPVVVGSRLLCENCLSEVDPGHLSLWRFDLERLLGWLAASLRLDGSVRAVDDGLWQLGSLTVGERRYECFFRRGGPLTDQARTRLRAYRGALLLNADPEPTPLAGFDGPQVSLLDVLRDDGQSLRVARLLPLLTGGGTVRFESASGCLWAGEVLAGEVPAGSKECHLLTCLAEHLDRYVAYADLKYEVLRRSGSRDTTDEATFCQKLKGRIKKRWVPRIDRLIATTNKGDGYRLRGRVDLS
jgi:hypothetical protein